MICYVCPESFTEEQNCIEIDAHNAEEALLKAQAISNEREELVDLFLPPEWGIEDDLRKLGPQINAELVSGDR